MVVFDHTAFFKKVHERHRTVDPPLAKADLGLRGVRGDEVDRFNHPHSLAIRPVVPLRSLPRIYV